MYRIINCGGRVKINHLLDIEQRERSLKAAFKSAGLESE